MPAAALLHTLCMMTSSFPRPAYGHHRHPPLLKHHLSAPPVCRVINSVQCALLALVHMLSLLLLMQCTTSTTRCLSSPHCTLLCAVYGIDLLLLVIISLVARAAEVRALLARSKEHKAAQARRKRVKKHETKHCKHGQGHQPAVPGKPMGAGTGSNSSKSAAAALQAGAIAGAKPLQIPHVVMVEDGDGSRGSETGEVTPAVPSGTSSGCPATPSTPTAGESMPRAPQFLVLHNDTWDHKL
jgi:hypothetical protein